MIDNDVVNDAIEYILEHILDNTTLEEVAEHCHLSKYYFDRMFKDVTGENVYAFIKRIKLEQSALKLKSESNRKITDIGLDYGYSASNYSSAFRQHHNISPVYFRKEVQYKYRLDEAVYNEINSKISIQILPDYLVAYERGIGNYSDMKECWCRFTETNKQYTDDSTIFFDRSYDDPSITDKDHCMYEVCMSIDKKYINEFPNTYVIKGGKNLVYPFKGKIEEIFKTHQALMGMWFPHSGYILDDRYMYSKYTKVGSAEYMEFDICIPVK